MSVMINHMCTLIMTYLCQAEETNTSAKPHCMSLELIHHFGKIFHSFYIKEKSQD